MNKIVQAMVAVVMVFVFSAGVLAAEKRGTAPEAEALVKKAVGMIKSNGKDHAFAEINKSNGKFIDRDLYIFVIDKNGNTLAHGFNQKLVGKNMLELRDPDGKFFIKEFISTAEKKENGWISYKFSDPQTKKVIQKKTFVERCDDLIVGCGIYSN